MHRVIYNIIRKIHLKKKIWLTEKLSANSNIICIFPCKCSPFVLILLLGILPFLAFSFPQKSSALALAPSPSILIVSKSAFKKSTDIFLVINKYLPTGILASNLLLVASFLCFILLSLLSHTTALFTTVSTCTELPRFWYDVRPA